MEGQRPRILIADPVAPEGIELLRTVGDVDVRTGLPADKLIASIGDYDALVVRSETKVTRPVVEAASKLAVIGRAGTAEIALAARDVSRKHAEIFAAHGEYFVRDLGSTNPTLLNGEKLGVEPKKLDHGDVVKVGAVELAFQLARGKGAAPPLQ